MTGLQEYIKKTFGIELKLKILTSNELDKLPLYLRKNLNAGNLLGQELILVENTGLTPDQYKKQAYIIENALQMPVVFVVENIESYNRKRLIQKKIGFIEPGRQMYIPNLLIDIKEYNKTKVKKIEKLPPAAQCLLFYYLLGNEITGINFKTIAEKINYGTMTITRAANLLAGLNLCKIEGGKEKRLIFEKDKNQLWRDAQPYLINPIHKEYYTDDNCNFNFVYKTGINALAYYSEIAATDRNFFAVSYEALKAFLEKEKIELLNSSGAKTVLQIWKYNPGILASDHVVDPLSLYITLKESNNERVQGELDKLINSLW